MKRSRYNLWFRITVATLGGAQGNVRPSAWLRTCGSGPWASSRVTFGPTPKNENEAAVCVLGLLSGAGAFGGCLVGAWWVVGIFCQCRSQMLAFESFVI